MDFCQEGQVLGGKYRLIRRLGQGGMGSVWHAQHLVLNAPVALKFIDSAQLDVEALQRFLGEARMAAALRSPHVVQILDYGVEQNTPHIAMELLEGETLAERLSRVGRLSLHDAARVVQHVGRALGRAHDAGIVHRDLKPENVFIVSNDDEELVKVLDFGIAKGNPATLGDSAAIATRTGAVLGTLYYMSPEQVDGGRALDHRADIWALGVLAFKCLVGQLPFAGDSVGRVVLAICSRPLPVPSQLSQVPAGFDAWFARACARQPGARFDSVREAAKEFLELCGGAVPSSTNAPSDSGVSTVAKLASQPPVALPSTTTGDATNSKLAAEVSQRKAQRLTRLLLVAGALAIAGSGGLWVWRGTSARSIEQAKASARPAPAAPATSMPEPAAPAAPETRPAPTNEPEASPGLVPSPAPIAPALGGASPAPRSSPVASPVAPARRPALVVSGREQAAAAPRAPEGPSAATPSSGASPSAAPASPSPRSRPPPERIPAVPTEDMDLGI